MPTKWVIWPRGSKIGATVSDVSSAVPSLRWLASSPCQLLRPCSTMVCHISSANNSSASARPCERCAALQAEQLLPVEAEHLFECAVDVVDLALQVRDEDAVACRFEGVLQQVVGLLKAMPGHRFHDAFGQIRRGNQGFRILAERNRPPRRAGRRWQVVRRQIAGDHQDRAWPIPSRCRACNSSRPVISGSR